ncbi:peptidoglycan-binding domain-containing protein [Rhizobium sp. 18055]|jgi:peptidoglycan hydrolase-like protein with peptidoglycan-binding domain|uniref:peptidoglycan-binding domain-containing protein n=1 Tax=Rhizobium sp. 18055 TaxID=2681403 RepID=UPI001358941F|nr:peptidoglycan-binding domain-containing protein [Rhizobium sp. 18055]
MAASKRKSPKGRKGRQKPGLVLTGATVVGGLGLQGATMLGGVLARNPSITGGSVAFLVIFSFVAANALWYQPGVHPHPFLRTRDALFPSALIGRPPAEEHTGEVTTFKIERQDDAGGAETTNAVPPAAAPGQPANQLVMDIQTELVRRGLYNGAPDGVIGPRTSAAILFFEETVGMPQSGDATPEVLAALKTDSVGPSTIPSERPREDVSSKASAEDPVAAAIRSAERTVKTAPTPISLKQTPATQASGKPAPSTTLSSVDLVLKIQQGLVNMAYTNVGIDGVVGEQTRVAIRHFQKHYNLPENGEPSEAVLKKLKDIGAL